MRLVLATEILISGQQHGNPFAGAEHELFGADLTPGIVAIERHGDREVALFQRLDGRVQRSVRTTAPWLIVPRTFAGNAYPGPESAENLAGDGWYGVRLRFNGWRAWRSAFQAMREQQLDVIAFQSPAEQYLFDSGQGCFRGIEFDDVLRVQLDIETTTLDPQAADAQLLLITVAVNGRNPVVFRRDGTSEAEMIRDLNAWLRNVDPDIIEGHNIFNFDIPYLLSRAEVAGQALFWGRDGSALRPGGRSRFKAGPRTIPYQAAYVYGRHIIDTYQQLQRYDVAGRLESYGLKPAIAQLGLERRSRTFVAGEEIAATWERDRELLIRYAIDDVLDTDALSRITLPTEMYQTRVLPRTLQSTATGGPGEKVNDLMVRAYLTAGHSIPVPAPTREYPGGYIEVRHEGRFTPVVKCDVESLYPSIMLTEQIKPRSDTLNIMLPMLRTLTQQRLHAKRAEQISIGGERANWNGIQSSFKVLINSFFGYLGYGRAYFNDFDAAASVTLRGQAIIQHIVGELEQRGALPIEIDTDGVYFRPPEHVTTFEQEVALIHDVSMTLGPGYNVAHNGRYKGMLSLKLKNYALLEYDGQVVLRGSSLRSRREERVLRDFISNAVPRLLEPEVFGAARDYYLDTAEHIQSGPLPVDQITRWEAITEATHSSATTRRLAEAVRELAVGERAQVYQRADGAIALGDDYADDPDRTYLLRRLKQMAERFRPLYGDATEFEYEFPTVTQQTDIDALRAEQPVRQMTLFG